VPGTSRICALVCVTGFPDLEPAAGHAVVGRPPLDGRPVLDAALNRSSPAGRADAYRADIAAKGAGAVRIVEAALQL
jgi:hypothetical protein